MKVLKIIFGILMIIFGVVCFFSPVVTALQLYHLFAILAVVYGTIGIIGGITSKSFGFDFVFSIVSVLFGLVLLFVPMMVLITDIIVIYMIACWLIVQGVVSAVSAVKFRKRSGSKMWILHLIIGILGVLIGIYSFFHPMILGLSLAWVLGLLVGVIFIQAGLSMMFFEPEAE